MKPCTIRLTHILAWLVFFLAVLVPCPVVGQGFAKKQLSETDYGLWGSLRTTAISDDGSWLSYTISYTSGVDTLFVKNTRSSTAYSLPGIKHGMFADKKRFAFLDRGRLQIISLDTGKRKYIENTVSYERAKDGHYLLVTVAEKDSGRTLQVCRTDGQVQYKVPGIEGYRLNSSRDALLYTTYDGKVHGIGIIGLSHKVKDRSILSGSLSFFSKLTWSEDGKAAAFQSVPVSAASDAGTLYLYKVKTGELSGITDATSGLFPADMKLSADNALRLRISSDHRRIFFGVEDRNAVKPPADNDKVEIWRGDDEILYPMQQEIRRSAKPETALAAWEIHSGRVHRIGKGQYQWALLVSDGKYAVTSGKTSDLNDFAYHQQTDYYISDVQTGDTELLLQGLPGPNSSFSASADGRFLAYFKDGNWWSFDTCDKRHSNLTEALAGTWDSGKADPGNTIVPYGAAGWSLEGDLLVYDSHDIWRISPLGNGGKRLTRGKEQSTRYRIASDNSISEDYIAYSSSSTRIIDTKKDLALSLENLKSGAAGFCRLSPEGRISLLTSQLHAAKRLFIANDGKSLIYEEQAFNEPPRIIHCSLAHNNRLKTVAQSNMHHNRYNWGHSEILSYTVGEDTLRAALIYPADFKKDRKYPMVTYIYEHLSQDVYKYINPSIYNIIGFNSANLSAKGYFVLLPDIRYREGEPGESALRCVTAAVQKTAETGMIDRAKIGLVGHSFGGYETNYIIAHTDLFAAAVSGGAISEIIFGYLSYGENTALIDYWRYENQQYRIRKTLFEDTGRYIANSPIFNAAKITTPLLTWTGKDDPTVRAQQSLLMYAALRRLKKKNILLMYPGEGHVLMDAENQKDLTMRVESWFDYYLKGEKPANWMVK